MINLSLFLTITAAVFVGHHLSMVTMAIVAYYRQKKAMKELEEQLGIGKKKSGDIKVNFKNNPFGGDDDGTRH